jgi:hypothetical protein
VQDTSASPPRIDAVSGDNYLNLSDNQRGLAITGLAEPHATVKMTLSRIAKTVVADGGGRWVANLTGAQVASLADGKLTVTAFQTDVAGNVSTLRSLQIRKDTVPPAAPTINAVTGDDIVLPAERKYFLKFTGTASANAAMGVIVGGIVNTTTAGRSGTWTLTLDAKHAGNLPLGNVSVIATVYDAAGNSASKTRVFSNR